MDRSRLPGLKAQAKEAIKAEQFTEAFLYLCHALSRYRRVLVQIHNRDLEINQSYRTP